MLTLNLQRIFTLRGISNPFTFLVSNGFTSSTASRILNTRLNSMNFAFVEKLCILFKCTPNDLLSWTPDKNVILPADIPLKTLSKNDAHIDLRQTLSSLTLDELEKALKPLSEKKQATSE